jgi:hypothetical protein
VVVKVVIECNGPVVAKVNDTFVPQMVAKSQAVERVLVTLIGVVGESGKWQ